MWGAALMLRQCASFGVLTKKKALRSQNPVPWHSNLGCQFSLDMVTTLEYDYVRNCNDPRTLEKIIHVLRSGEEGSYPHLLREMCPVGSRVNAAPTLSTSEMQKLVSRARQLYQEGDFLQASLQYQKVLECDSLNAEALRGMAAIQERARGGGPLL
nr:uncharacterized protein LOC128684395 [Cherax quadricarinatus]